MQPRPVFLPLRAGAGALRLRVPRLSWRRRDFRDGNRFRLPWYGFGRRLAIVAQLGIATPLMARLRGPGLQQSRGLHIQRSVMSDHPILITGAAGFIGFHVASRLLKEGRPVVGVDNLNRYYDPALKDGRLEILRRIRVFASSRPTLPIAQRRPSCSLRIAFRSCFISRPRRACATPCKNPDALRQFKPHGFCKRP